MLRLELVNISKQYPAVKANDAVNLRVQPGEIHAVLGENGAGKSTLMKMIYGAVRPDAGEIRWNGEAVHIRNPQEARALGISMVFQHFSLFDTLTAAENVWLGLDKALTLPAVTERIVKVTKEYGLDVDPLRPVHTLSVGERQRVEIVRALMTNPKCLILDEPTSVLTPQAVEKLFVTLRQLAAHGTSILYISHKLDEIQELCHTATVLRAGKVTGTCIPSRETPKSMARMMIGRDLPVCEHGQPAPHTDPRLSIAGLSRIADDQFGTTLENLQLNVFAGEIVGIAGVSGNGQRELLYALSGETPTAGHSSIRICGNDSGRYPAGRRRRLGLGFVPEERLGRGAVPKMSLASNALLTGWRHGMLKNSVLIDRKAVRTFAARVIEQYNVKCGGPDAEARSLSGGNLQKFIVGREVLLGPKVLIVSQPTWGVDVGAAAFIRQSLIDLRNAGTAVLVISEELDELFEICDRIAVIAKGRLSPAKAIADTNVEEIGVWMSGMWPGTERSDATVTATTASHV